MKINIKAGSFWVRRFLVHFFRPHQTVAGSILELFCPLFDQHILGWSFSFLVTLPETNIFAPENGWLEYDPFLLGFGEFFQGRFVSFREGTTRVFGSVSDRNDCDRQLVYFTYLREVFTTYFYWGEIIHHQTFQVPKMEVLTYISCM